VTRVTGLSLPPPRTSRLYASLSFRHSIVNFVLGVQIRDVAEGCVQPLYLQLRKNHRPWTIGRRLPEEIKSLCGSPRQGLICGRGAALRMEIVDLRADHLETSSSRQVSSNTGISSCSATRDSFGVTAKTKRAVDCRPVDTENLRDLFQKMGPVARI
jgi:hypothetical protein